MTAVVLKQSSVTQLKSSLRSSVTFPESRPDQGLHRTVQSPYCSPSDHTPRPENKQTALLHTAHTVHTRTNEKARLQTGWKHIDFEQVHCWCQIKTRQQITSN